MREKRWWVWACVIVVLAAISVLSVLFVGRRGSPRPDFRSSLHQSPIANSNIVLITLDTTRADHLSPYGYTNGETPNLARLANQSVLFEQCITPSAFTLPSHASIMTGLYPNFHGLRINGNTALSDVHPTLAKSLAAKGYATGAFIGAFVLDGRWGLAGGFERYDDDFDLSQFRQVDLAAVQRPADKVMDAALNWMEGAKEKAFFSWIHLYDPHTPYEPPEPYRSRFISRGSEGMYDGEIAFVDAQIGRLMDWLKERRLDEKTILVVVADHGEGLGSHGEMTHGYFVYDYAIHVPLLIKIPLAQSSARRISTQVRTIDIYPTVLDVLGIPAPPQCQGSSLIPLLDGQGELPEFAYSESVAPNLQYGWSSLYGLRDGSFKYIDAPKPELYDLREDRYELHNLVTSETARAAKMKAALDTVRTQTSAGAPNPESANIDQDTLTKLASLGYIGGPVSVKEGKDLLDPKDTIETYRAISGAAELISREEFEKAAFLLENVLKPQPLLPQANLLLATCYTKLKRHDDAKAQLDRVLRDNPKSIQALITLANILSAEGKTSDMINVCQSALAVDETSPQAHSLIGQAYMEEKAYDKAFPHLQRAAQIQPKLTRNRQNLAACLVGLRRFAEADQLLVDILATNPEFPMANYHRGLMYEELGKIEQAKTNYEKEISLHSQAIQARFNLGLIEMNQGNLKGYLEQMEALVTLAPEAPKGYLFLARGLLREPSDLDRIERLVQTGLSNAKTPDMMTLGYLLLADVYARKHQPDRVNQALEKAKMYRTQATVPPSPKQ